jgi:hypothetical protein
VKAVEKLIRDVDGPPDWRDGEIHVYQDRALIAAPTGGNPYPLGIEITRGRAEAGYIWLTEDQVVSLVDAMMDMLCDYRDRKKAAS